MNPIDRVIVISQIFILAVWEFVGIVAFGWPALTIAACWFVGLWTFNILTATAVRTFFKLTAPPPDKEAITTVDMPEITEDDIGA